MPSFICHKAMTGFDEKAEFQDSEISARKRKSAVACGQLRQPAEMQRKRSDAVVQMNFVISGEA